MHKQGYSYHGDAPIAGLTKREADCLVLGELMHNSSQRSSDTVAGHKQQLRANHRQKTVEMLNNLKN